MVQCCQSYRQSDWNSAAVSVEKYNRFNSENAEGDFQRMAIGERTKFDKEVNDSGYATIKADSVGTPTSCIVSLLVAVRGQSDAAIKVRNSSDMRNVLQTLASEALTDEGNNIMGVELLWTPSERGSIISEQEIVANYPELIQM